MQYYAQYFFVLGLGALLCNLFCGPHFAEHYDMDSPIWWVLGVFGILFLVTAIGLLIAVLCIVPQVAVIEVYDAKIAVYGERNKIAEEQVISAVKSYLEHEKDVYGDWYKEIPNATTAIGIYIGVPELKGDSLVAQQIEIYQSNLAEITQLKLERAELSRKRWLLTFQK